MPTYQEDQILTLLHRLVYDLNESGGIQHPPHRVEKNLACGGMACKQIESPYHNLTHLTPCIAAAALDELSRDCVCMLIAWFADKIQQNFQVFF